MQRQAVGRLRSVRSGAAGAAARDLLPPLLCRDGARRDRDCTRWSTSERSRRSCTARCTGCEKNSETYDDQAYDSRRDRSGGGGPRARDRGEGTPRRVRGLPRGGRGNRATDRRAPARIARRRTRLGRPGHADHGSVARGRGRWPTVVVGGAAGLALAAVLVVAVGLGFLLSDGPVETPPVEPTVEEILAEMNELLSDDSIPG